MRSRRSSMFMSSKDRTRRPSSRPIAASARRLSKSASMPGPQPPRRMIRDGAIVDDSWRHVDDGDTEPLPEGDIIVGTDRWTAEFSVPFKSLRFPKADQQTWGINFLRRVRRKGENSYWAPLPYRIKLGRESFAGKLTGLQGVTPGRNLKVTPYVTANFKSTAAQWRAKARPRKSICSRTSQPGKAAARASSSCAKTISRWPDTASSPGASSSAPAPFTRSFMLGLVRFG